jgi:hypothetical protein
LLKAILAGELDILIGTQMMVKGHDFPRLTFVGILGADNALYSADFRATERLYAQLMQVAGRAGRAELPGEVVIQTDFPNHPLYQALVTNDDHAHIESLFTERRQLGLPPYSRLAMLRAEGASEDGRRAVSSVRARGRHPIGKRPRRTSHFSAGCRQDGATGRVRACARPRSISVCCAAAGLPRPLAPVDRRTRATQYPLVDRCGSAGCRLTRAAGPTGTNRYNWRPRLIEVSNPV